MFYAGYDLKDLQGIGQDREVYEFWQTQSDQILNRGLEVGPVVAAVNGLCLAGGMTLLLATDIRVASEHASSICPRSSAAFSPGMVGRIAPSVSFRIRLPWKCCCS